MPLLIKNGTVVTAADFHRADVLIEGEHVKAIGHDLKAEGAEVIDAKGMFVLPGGIDPHVHLDMPFMGTFSSDNYETGTLAALHGGTTTVIDFILQTQGKSLRHALETWQGRMNGNLYGDLSWHMAVTDFNDDTKKEVKEMIEQEGITSFKTFMAYKGALMIDDRQMVGLMNEVKAHGGIVTVHATNGDMIDFLVQKHRAEGKLSPLYHYLSQPEITEAEATGRFADMASYTGVPAYIVHMTCEGALNHVRDAARRNQRVLAETCIQYLLLDASLYEKADGAKWVMSPPLREKKDQAALWGAIDQGTVQVVATDHCPFMMAQKAMGSADFSKIPNGHPAIEHRMELLFSEGVNKKRITVNKFVEVTATNPAKIFGMFPRKGTIGIGSDADIILLDPNERHTLSAKTHHMNVDYSGYEGMELTGKVKTTILRGQVAVHNGEVRIKKGYGSFVKRNKVSGML
ncbi:MAG: dihydropyrimidinase [Flavobacteriales bacterium]|jgi:dihydropyrimidinase|nr:dihydropyrimidinase [Flavobacteriales bacterium]MBK7100834.1 dihydropyrimidinase [Flavobacteriales bacterium]MBK7111521.1 dihydropyrimidinase [Flavobacteriales bacterium]MBK8532830.1 dihydropyrimidinase [Flavobacteriales bacterium]MBK8709275.1 dihydropyrimidinase [Flavobacteriales bacterium]